MKFDQQPWVQEILKCERGPTDAEVCVLIRAALDFDILRTALREIVAITGSTGGHKAMKAEMQHIATIALSRVTSSP